MTHRIPEIRNSKFNRQKLCRLAALGIALTALVGWNRLAEARQKPPAKIIAAAPAADKKMGSLTMDDWAYDEQTSVGTGRNLHYIESDTVITGDAAQYHRAEKRLYGEGSIVIDDPRHHVTCGKADVDQKAKLAILTETVVMVIKPNSSDTPPQEKSQDVGTERKRGVTVYCDHVEDYYRRKFAILRGHLIFKQKLLKKNGQSVERTLTAEHAEYDGKTEKMLLFKPVLMHDTDGQESKFADDVIVGTKEGAETLQSKGKVETRFIIEDDEDNSTDAKK